MFLSLCNFFLCVCFFLHFPAHLLHGSFSVLTYTGKRDLNLTGHHFPVFIYYLYYLRISISWLLQFLSPILPSASLIQLSVISSLVLQIPLLTFSFWIFHQIFSNSSPASSRFFFLVSLNIYFYLNFPFFSLLHLQSSIFLFTFLLIPISIINSSNSYFHSFFLPFAFLIAESFRLVLFPFLVRSPPVPASSSRFQSCSYRHSSGSSTSSFSLLPIFHRRIILIRTFPSGLFSRPRLCPLSHDFP